MSVILTSADYDGIRALLDASTSELPNSALDTIGLVPLANAYLSNIVPDFSALSGNDVTFAKAAATYLVAAASIQIVQFKRSQTTKLGDMEESNYKNVDWEKLRTDLKEMAASLIYRLTTVANSLVVPTVFSVSGPTSSGYNRPNYLETWFARIEPKVITWLNSPEYLNTELIK